MLRKEAEDSSSKEEFAYVQIQEWKDTITYIRLTQYNQTTILNNSHCQRYREMYA